MRSEETNIIPPDQIDKLTAENDEASYDRAAKTINIPVNHRLVSPTQLKLATTILESPEDVALSLNKFDGDSQTAARLFIKAAEIVANNSELDGTLVGLAHEHEHAISNDLQKYSGRSFKPGVLNEYSKLSEAASIARELNVALLQGNMTFITKLAARVLNTYSNMATGKSNTYFEGLKLAIAPDETDILSNDAFINRCNTLLNSSNTTDLINYFSNRNKDLVVKKKNILSEGLSQA